MTEADAPSRADATRARLLAAAAEAFADRGFHGTTTRDIAAAAGMSPAAVYVHYKSKEQLLHQLSRVGHQRIIDAIDMPPWCPPWPIMSSALWPAASLPP